MKRTVLLALSLVLAGSIAASAAAGRDHITGGFGMDQLKECLVENQAWVPFPAYSDRAGWDALMGSNRESIIAGGEKYLDYEWKVIRMSTYMEYAKSGDRYVNEVPYDDNNNAIARLFAAELAEGRGRFIPQIVDGVMHTCEMTSWAISAHVASFSPDGRPLPKQGDTTLELVQGNVSQMLSWIYYFLHEEFDRMDPEISRRLKSELVRRELDPYLTETSYWWMGFDPDHMLNNWNPWCNTNALVCFMLIEDDLERLTRGVWKSMWSVDQYLNRIQGDGGIEEGPSYWGHSAGMVYEYARVIHLATGGAVNLFGIDQIRGMGEYIVNSYVGDGWVVNFADASARGGADDSNLIYRFGKATGSAMMMGYAAEIRAAHPGRPSPGSNVLAFLESLSVYDEFSSAAAGYEARDYVWYPQTQFHYVRGARGLFLAAKAGYNDESHNHNDVGSFCLYADNLPVFIDAGVGTYTAKTFSAQRYDIWTMQTDYHNLPLINGVPQRNGREYRAGDVYSSSSCFRADIAGAYPEEAAVRSWVRSYSLKGGTLSISDSFDLVEAKAPNQVNFLAWGEVDASVPGVVTLSVQGRNLILKYDSSAFTAEKETISVDDPRLSAVWGPQICRIRLTARKLQRKGSYRFSITRR